MTPEQEAVVQLDRIGSSRRVAFALALARRRTVGQGPQRFVAALRGRRFSAEDRSALAGTVAARRQALALGRTVQTAANAPTWPPPKAAAPGPAAAQPQGSPARTLEPGRASSGAALPPAQGSLGRTLPSADVGLAGPERAARPAEPPLAVRQAGSMPLDARTRARLAGLLDIRIPAVRLYVSQAADAVARRHRADAVTYGRHILVRVDRYNPGHTGGLALLGHEVTHAAQATPAQGGGPYGPRTPVEQEAAALANEQRILRSAAPGAGVPPIPLPPPAGSPGAGAPPQSAPAAPAAQPQTAAAGRSLNGGSSPGANGGLLAEPQLRQLKEIIYQDLLKRIRTEFERGG